MTASRDDERLDVLITSAGRKVLLVRAFQEAMRRLDAGGRVFASDVSPWAVALREADGIVDLPRSDDPLFSDALSRACATEGIGLVVPTRDDELPILAALRERLAAAGTTILVPPSEAVEICRDKVRFAALLGEAGFETPAIHAVDEAPLPAFVKPRFGAGSRHARVVRTEDEAAAAIAAITAGGGEPLVQELVEGSEYSVDVFLDVARQPISCVPRERIEVVNGESVVSRTVHDDELASVAIGVCRALGLLGHITVQAFRAGDRILVIEVNPRYGGAANLGFAAGAPTPEFAIRLARGESLEPQVGRHEAGLLMLRYGDDRFEREPVHVGDPVVR